MCRALQLCEAKASADRGEDRFRTVCRAHGFADEWEAYRAEMRGETWPQALKDAHAAWMRALHGFFAMRDGPNGFLGARGL